MWKWLTRFRSVPEPRERFSIEGIELDMPIDVVRSLEPSMAEGVRVTTRRTATGEERTLDVSGARLMLGREVLGLPTHELPQFRARLEPSLGRPRRYPTFIEGGTLTWTFRQGPLICTLDASAETGPSVLRDGVIGPSLGELRFSLRIDVREWSDDAVHFSHTFGRPRLRQPAAPLPGGAPHLPCSQS